MKPIQKLAWLLCVTATLLSAFAQVRVHAQAPASNVGAHLVVIVSSRSPTRALSINTIRDIFLGVPTYMQAGEPYVPMTQSPRTPQRTAFDKQFLGLDPDAVGRYWIDQRIRARAMPPRSIPSLDTLRRVVASVPQAISYLRADELQPGLVPIKIDGVDFRSPEYRYQIGLLVRSGSLGARPSPARF